MPADTNSFAISWKVYFEDGYRIKYLGLEGEDTETIFDHDDEDECFYVDGHTRMKTDTFKEFETLSVVIEINECAEEQHNRKVIDYWTKYTQQIVLNTTDKVIIFIIY